MFYSALFFALFLVVGAFYFLSNRKQNRAPGLREAMAIINRDKAAAAKIYIEEEKSKLAPEFVLKVISDPQFIFTVAPQGFMKFADFMTKTEALKVKPSSWKDVFLNFARLRLQLVKTHSMKRISTRSSSERSQFLKVQLSYSPFCKGCVLRSLLSKV